MKVIKRMGQGPVLNVLHGWGMNSHLLDKWAEQLSLTYQVNLIDLPGHGLNQEQLLPTDLISNAELANEIPDGIWLGWSMGGMLALNVALKKPEKVKALVMLCATPCFTKNNKWPFGTDANVLEEFGKNVQQDIKKTIQTFLALEVLGSRDEKKQLKILKQSVFERPLPQRQALINGLVLLRQVNLIQELKKLEQASLWISGRRDRLVLPQAVEQASQMCQGEYHMIRGSGHAPFINHAEQLSQLMLDFI